LDDEGSPCEAVDGGVLMEWKIQRRCGHEVCGGGFGFIEEQGTPVVLVEVVAGPEGDWRRPATGRSSAEWRTMLGFSFLHGRWLALLAEGGLRSM
jgi:hypothetical protein